MLSLDTILFAIYVMTRSEYLLVLDIPFLLLPDNKTAGVHLGEASSRCADREMLMLGNVR